MKDRNSTSLIRELPAPPAGKTGWPWDIESRVVQSDSLPEDGLPKITIVTPSYNQGGFLEETIRSILLQNYPKLEYIIIDGGSTDNSVEIIKKYEPWIDYWVSEPDRGQSHAINKGFERATGQWGNWINSDDLLAKDALLKLAGYVEDAEPKTLFIGQCILTDKYRTTERISISNIETFEQLIDIKNYWRNGQSIAQQNVLYNLDSYHAVGGLNEENHYSMDFELWGDLLLHGSRIQQVNFPVGIFRHYDGQKISDQKSATDSLVKAVKQLIKRNHELNYRKKLKMRTAIAKFNWKYRYGYLRSMIGLRRRLSTFIND